MRNLLDVGECCADLGRRASEGSLPVPDQRLALDPSDYKDPAYNET